MPNKTQTPPVLTYQDPDFNRVNVQLSPANQQYALNAATIASRSLLPKIQLEKFDGDVSMFRILRKSYQSIVESNLMNDSEESKLVYLLNHLKGEPHELVQSCMFLNRDKYVRAWSLLEKRYGNNVSLVAIKVNELMNVPNIHKNDLKMLTWFYNCLQTCEALVGTHSELNHQGTISKLMNKLPENMQSQFRKIVYYQCTKICCKISVKKLLHSV